MGLAAWLRLQAQKMTEIAGKYSMMRWEAATIARNPTARIASTSERQSGHWRRQSVHASGISPRIVRVIVGPTRTMKPLNENGAHSWPTVTVACSTGTAFGSRWRKANSTFRGKYGCVSRPMPSPSSVQASAVKANESDGDNGARRPVCPSPSQGGGGWGGGHPRRRQAVATSAAPPSCPGSPPRLLPAPRSRRRIR